MSIQLLAQAIERAEGTSAGLGKGVSANNPGNLQDVYGNELQYSTPQQGQSALESYLQRAISGSNQNYSGPNETLGDFLNTYSGGSVSEGTNVSQFTGVPLNAPVSTFTGGQSTPAQTSTSTLPDWLQYLPGYDQVSKAAGGATSTIQDYIVRGAAILAGLVFIAGAVFGFNRITTTVIEGAKKGAEIAAL